MLASTAAIGIIFGTNAFLFILFQAVKYLTPVTKFETDAIEVKKEKKELSKPFDGQFDDFYNLTTELFRCGLILALTFICEWYPLFEHSQKDYSRDLFFFVLIIFFAYAFYTIKPIHDLTLLGREQTEEWKGWMQFIFLLYHYFKAEEVYNSVRVMITCYVWMTGFGNFSFFYVKQDYGWLRLAQMLWRLNFSVLLLMWTHGNTYILYYICPMHTFYFFMVFATMYCFQSVNYSKWGIRIKLFIVGLIIYLVWDINQGLFDKLFFFLGTDTVIGAPRGSVWEYYFRTSLDHYSSFFGMIFALNFPLAEQYFNKAKGYPLIIAGVLMGVLSILWVVFFFTKEKLEYNLTHSYTAIVPLTSYIFFRNITPYIRSGVSMSLHDLGKTTLETYLLQHHIWLTSNAKTLLTIVPNHPWINFALATMLFFTVAKELYRITMSLRGMVMPDDETIALRNIAGMTALVGCAYLLAFICTLVHAAPFDVLLLAIAATIATIAFIRSACPSLMENSVFKTTSLRFMAVCSAALLIGIVVSITTVHSSSSSLTSSLPNYNVPLCVSSATEGYWVHEPCPVDSVDALTAQCQMDRWEWNKSSCPIAQITGAKLKAVLKGKKVAFIGDSIMRSTYHEFNKLLDPIYSFEVDPDSKHQDLSHALSKDGISVDFKWAPLAKDATAAIDSLPDSDLVITGVASWDALNTRDLSVFKSDLEALSIELADLRAFTIWILPTPVVDKLLPSPEKQQYMKQEELSKYKQAVLESRIPKAVGQMVDPSSAVATMEFGSVDGIHYVPAVYDTIVQMLSNAYLLHHPDLLSVKPPPPPSQGPKPTGSMSFPSYGALTLLLAAIMLFLMDTWLGFGWCSLLIGGKAYDWNEAFIPLHKKLGVGEAAVVVASVSDVEESGSLLDEDPKAKH